MFFYSRFKKQRSLVDEALLLAAFAALLVALSTLVWVTEDPWKQQAFAAFAPAPTMVQNSTIPADIEYQPPQAQSIEQPAGTHASGQWQVAEKKLGEDVMQFLEKECADQQVPVALALGVIEAESNFEPNVISPTNDYGLMQIHAGPNNRYHQYYRELLGVRDFLDPYDNIRVGVYLLGENLRQSGDNVPLSLMSYHLGNTAAKHRWSEGVTSTAATRKQLDRYYQYLSEQDSP